jgi:hypothetical protein
MVRASNNPLNADSPKENGSDENRKSHRIEYQIDCSWQDLSNVWTKASIRTDQAETEIKLLSDAANHLAGGTVFLHQLIRKIVLLACIRRYRFSPLWTAMLDLHIGATQSFEKSAD